MQMVRQESEWAANMIQEVEKKIENNTIDAATPHTIADRCLYPLQKKSEAHLMAQPRDLVATTPIAASEPKHV